MITEDPVLLARQYHLNPHLVKKQDLSADQVREIIDLHTEMDALIGRCRVLDAEETLLLGDMQNVGQVIEALEFKMQYTWGFTQDSTMHTHWKRIPQCLCDANVKSAMQAARLPHEDCPVHQSKELVIDAQSK